MVLCPLSTEAGSGWRPELGTHQGLGLETVLGVQAVWGEAIAWGEAKKTSDPKQSRVGFVILTRVPGAWVTLPPAVRLQGRAGREPVMVY